MRTVCVYVWASICGSCFINPPFIHSGGIIRGTLEAVSSVNRQYLGFSPSFVSDARQSNTPEQHHSWGAACVKTA